MKLLRLLLAVATLSMFAIRTSAAAEPKDEGFVPLLNGKDLSGWTVMGKKEGWSVQDDILRSEGGKGGEWLRSEKEYGDYIFKVQWRVSKGGNSGVFIRCLTEGHPWITGYEVQISQDVQDAEHSTGSLYGYVPVNPIPDVTPDKWHTFEIHCVGPKITIFIDGVKSVDADQSKIEAIKDKPLKGHIGLQDSHSAAGHYIEYRDVKIKVLGGE